MKTPIPRPGPGVVRFVSVTVYPPGEDPQTFKEGQILAAGLQEGTPVCAVRNDATDEITEYLGIPLKVVKAPPSGLVAPGPSGLVGIPPI